MPSPPTSPSSVLAAVCSRSTRPCSARPPRPPRAGTPAPPPAIPAATSAPIAVADTACSAGRLPAPATLTQNHRARRGTTCLYRREDLDAFIRESGTISSGRPATPGEDHADDHMDRRVRADEVSGNPQNPDGLPRARARGGPADRHVEREERALRR